MPELAIVLDEVGYAYDAQRWVLRGVSGSIRQGSILAVLGPNGVGKTTLLRILTGHLGPQEGSADVRGSIALVPQVFTVAFDYSVEEMVLMGRARKIGTLGQPRTVDIEAARQALDRFGILDLKDRLFNTLSGGQRQLVILARAIVAEADIIVMDEPCAALDLRNQVGVLEWIKRVSQEHHTTIVFTTHTPQHALAIADQALLLAPGIPGEIGATESILSASTLTQTFGVEFYIGRIGDSDGYHAVPILSFGQ